LAGIAMSKAHPQEAPLFRWQASGLARASISARPGLSASTNAVLAHL
jgi:hypothetical protein